MYGIKFVVGENWKQRTEEVKAQYGLQNYSVNGMQADQAERCQQLLSYRMTLSGVSLTGVIPPFPFKCS